MHIMKHAIHSYAVICLLFLVLLVASAGCTGADKTNLLDNPTKTENGILATTSSEQPTIIVAINKDLAPFTYADVDNNPKGFDIDTLNAIATSEGYTIEYVFVPWAEALSGLTSRDYDLVAGGVIVTPERQASFDFSDPYWQLNLTYVVNTDSPFAVSDIESGTARIGALSGSTSAQYLTDTYITPGTITPEYLTLYNTTDGSLIALRDGDLNAVLMDAPTAQSMIRGDPYMILNASFTIAELVRTQDNYAFAVRKGNNELLTDINNGLANLRANEDWKRTGAEQL